MTRVESRESRDERRGVTPAKGGAAILVQRFGSALNLNLHFHALVLDGVYSIEGPLAKPEFHAAPPLRDSDVLALTGILHDRIIRALRRRGHLADEGDVPPDEIRPRDRPAPKELFRVLAGTGEKLYPWSEMTTHGTSLNETHDPGLTSWLPSYARSVRGVIINIA